MPQFTPPQSAMSPLIGQLISDKMRQAQWERAQNARIIQQQDVWKQKLAMQGIDPTSDLSAVARVMAERQALATEGAESTLASQKMARTDQAAAPIASGIAALGPPNAGESGDIASLRMATQEGIRPYANQPEVLNRISALVAGERAGQNQVLAGERRATGRVIAGERRGVEVKQDEEFQAAGANLLSEAYVSGDDSGKEDVKDGFIARWGVNEGGDRFVEADFEAQSIALEEARSRKTLAGRSEFAHAAEAHMHLNPGLSEQDAFAMAAKVGAVDTFAQKMTGQPIVVPLQGMPAKDFQKGRQAIASLYDMFGEAEASFARLEDNPELVGPLIGLTDAQAFLRAFGAENPEAAYYASFRNQIVATTLKAQQGSRPSDYDLRFYLQLMPDLTEVGAGTAGMRFRGMRKIMEIQADAQTDPATREKLEALRAKPWTKADYDLKAASKRYTEGVEKLTPGDVKGRASHERAFDRAVKKWKSVRGKEFTPEANGLGVGGGGSPLTPATDPDLKAFEESGGFGD